MLTRCDESVTSCPKVRTSFICIHVCIRAKVSNEYKVQGRWGRVATRCAASAERDEVSHREDDVIMHKDYDCRQAYV